MGLGLAIATALVGGILASPSPASAHHESVSVSREGGVAIANASGVNGGVAVANASGGSGGVAVASASPGSGNRVTAQPGVTVSVGTAGTARASASPGRVVIGR